MRIFPTTFTTGALLCGALLSSGVIDAAPRDQAKRIHDRIAGVPPSDAVLTQMASLVNSGDVRGAALVAMDQEPFYSVTLKNMVAPWTNRDFNVFVPLNDYTATVIGVVRDGRDFRDVLSADVLYVGAQSLGLPAYANGNNNHYEQLESSGASLRNNLVATSQSSVTGLPAGATAGVLTTRAAAKAFFIAGTNRAQFRYTLVNHLCLDLEQVKDISRAPNRIRQDVTRSPGGDSRIFLNNCIGCHSGMDPMAQAFAYYNYTYDVDNDPEGVNGAIDYNAAGDIDPDTLSRVQKKYHINKDNFRDGFVTPDDHWDNYWRQGQSAFVGWDSGLAGSGDGAKSLGQELANTRAFAQCHSTHVFQTACLRTPQDAADRAEVASIAGTFEASGYNLKEAFAAAAEYCMGE